MWRTLKRMLVFFVVAAALAAAGPFLRRHQAPRHLERGLNAVGLAPHWSAGIAGGFGQGIALGERAVARACKVRLVLSKVPVSELKAMTAACDAPAMVRELEGLVWKGR